MTASSKLGTSPRPARGSYWCISIAWTTSSRLTGMGPRRHERDGGSLRAGRPVVGEPTDVLGELPGLGRVAESRLAHQRRDVIIPVVLERVATARDSGQAVQVM